MIDSYTKIILGVIASALVVIAARGAIQSANAVDQPCGSSNVDPCYVKIDTGPLGFPVYLKPR
jgi:hypothetical protein